MSIQGVPVEKYLKAIALIHNRLGEVDAQDDSDFDFLIQDDTRDELAELLMLVAGVTAYIMENLGAIFEAITGDPWIDHEESLLVGRQCLTALTDELVAHEVTTA